MRARLYHPWRKEDYLRSLAWLHASSRDRHDGHAPAQTGASSISWEGGRVAAVDDLQALLPAGWSQRRGLMTSRGDVDLWLATDGWCGRRASYRDAPYAHPGRAPWFEA